MRLKETRYVTYALLCMLCVAVLLVACGGGTQQTQTTAPAATPTVNAGQQILAASAQKLRQAKTLHGLFATTISGPTTNGSVNTEVWTMQPAQSRTLVLQSSAQRLAVQGAITVNNGKQVWQYDPQQKVVYTGPATSAGGNGSGSNNASTLPLGLLQVVFTRSDATLVSSSATSNGRAAYDIHVVPQAQATGTSGTPFAGNLGSINYDGDIYIDKVTQQPLQLNLNLQGIGHILLTMTKLELNIPIPASTFTFSVPTGVKVLPLQQANQGSGSGSLTLAQAQQQADFHLLSIPKSQSVYVLQGIDALGAPGSQLYTLNYLYNGQSVTLVEGRPLASVPPASGQQVSVRGATGTVSSINNTTTLAWSEQGIGLRLSANGLSSTQLLAIANILS